jgi:hypothetical protein
MPKPPQIRLPVGLKVPAPPPADEPERHDEDLAILKEIVAGLDRLEETLNQSPVPAAVTARGYFTPDEDDRVRQGVLAYRNYRLVAYEIILGHRDYATGAPERQLHNFLLAYGAALVLYAKSLKIIAFAEHVPLLRAKINEPDMKFDMPGGFFDDVLACYSQPSNYWSLRQAHVFWRVHRRAIQAFVREAGGDWAWLVEVIRTQRRQVRKRFWHVLWERLQYDWRGFLRTLVSPLRQARQKIATFLGGLADTQVTPECACAVQRETLCALRPHLQPGDVLLVRNDSRLTTALLPGFWTHAALFLGSRADLERLGVPLHQHARRYWKEIPDLRASLGLVIEAQFPAVQVNPIEKCLQVDHLLVLRAALPEEEIAAAIGEALSQLHKPYDFEFDFNNSSRVVCTELVYRSYHHRGTITFSLTKRLGRFTLTGDDIVGHALDSEDGVLPPAHSFLKPVALILKRRDGQAYLVRSERIVPLLRRIRRGWRPTWRVHEKAALRRRGR